MQLVLLKPAGNTKKSELYEHDVVKQPRAYPNLPTHWGIQKIDS